MTDLSPHYITSFIDNVMHVAQTRGSILLPHVDFQSGYEGEKVAPIKTFGSTKARVGAARNADTPIMGTPRDRRWISPTQVDWGDLIDPKDIIAYGGDPTSNLVEAAGMALGRALDEDIIVPAFFGANYTGKSGETSTAFDTSNSVAVTYDGAGGSTNLGLTAAKLARAKRLLKGNKERLDMDVLNIAYPADQHEALMEDIHTTSKDYAVKARKDEDDIQGYMGYNFIPFEGLVTQSDGDYHLPVWLSKGMHCGEFGTKKDRITERADKSYNTQIYMQRFWGATRTQETKVARIICEPKA